MNSYRGLADQVADILTPRMSLCQAIEAGDAALVKHQLDAGANPNLEYTYEIRYGFTRTSFPLITAVYEGNATIAALLLLAGADPGIQGEEALHVAIRHNDTARIASSLYAGMGNTVSPGRLLSMAIRSQKIDMVEMALRVCAKADVNAADASGNSALHRAVRRGHTAIVAALIEAGTERHRQKQER